MIPCVSEGVVSHSKTAERQEHSWRSWCEGAFVCTATWYEIFSFFCTANKICFCMGVDYAFEGVHRIKLVGLVELGHGAPKPRIDPAPCVSHEGSHRGLVPRRGNFTYHTVCGHLMLAATSFKFLPTPLCVSTHVA